MKPESTSRFNSVEWRLIRHFWRACTVYPLDLSLTVFIPCSAIMLGSIIPFLIGKLLASLTNPAVDPLGYVPYLIVVGIVGVVGNRIGYSHLLGLQAKVMGDLQSQTLRTLLYRSTGFHTDRVSGKLVSDASDYPHTFVNLSNALFVNIIPFLVVMISGVIIVLCYSVLLGLLLLGVSTLAIGSGIVSTKGRSPLRKRRHAVYKKVISHLADTIVNIQTVKTFAGENREMSTHKHLNAQLTQIRLSDWQKAAKSNSSRILMVTAFQIGFIVIAALMAHRDPALLGIGIFAFSYTITLTNRLIEINGVIRALEDAFLQGTPMQEVIDSEPEIVDRPEAKDLVVDHGSVAFKKVGFAYHQSDTNQRVFRNLTIAIQPGQKVGLVGPSGGGKSTLTRLLLRFDDIDSGSITIDGHDIRQLTQSSLRKNVSYVPQEPLLFHRSILENIAYGKTGASKDLIEQAARMAFAHDFIMSLPDGYDTLVGERGVKLSGGQRQRIAIARAILKDAPILVLDEATSALDSESEILIQKALWKLMKGRTSIVIAHRLSTIQRMDRIVVLNDGAIAEDGKHADLLKHNGLYAKLWTHQSGGFLDLDEIDPQLSD